MLKNEKNLRREAERFVEHQLRGGFISRANFSAGIIDFIRMYSKK